MSRILFLMIAVLLISCKKDKTSDKAFKQELVDLGTHKIATYSIETDSKYLVVFESGLGDDHNVWNSKKVAASIAKNSAVLIYDRAGYGKSSIDDHPRNIERLSTELKAVIDKFSNGRKVILVGHSLGGLIIRDYAIKNPEKTAGILFVDPSHEAYNQPTQAVEDIIYNAFKTEYGVNGGATKEVRELIEDFAYCSRLGNLPNIPVIVLTSMKKDNSNNTSDQTYGKTRQDWYDAHEQLKKGVTNFTHIQTTASGHYIMKEEPSLVIDNFSLLISKLP